jgi:hypothetical protein
MDPSIALCLLAIAVIAVVTTVVLRNRRAR